MDLALSPEHKAFADEVRAFARANLSPATREKTWAGKHYDKADHVEWQQALGRRGWLPREQIWGVYPGETID